MIPYRYLFIPGLGNVCVFFNIWCLIGLRIYIYTHCVDLKIPGEMYLYPIHISHSISGSMLYTSVYVFTLGDDLRGHTYLPHI